MRKSALQVLITAYLIAAGLSAHAQNSSNAPPPPSGGVPGAPAGTAAQQPDPAAQYALPTQALPPAAPDPAQQQYAPPEQPAPGAAPYAPPTPGYISAIRDAIKRNIVWQGPKGNYETTLSVHCAPNGNVLDFAIARSSGNPQWDAAVINAVQKSSPLPVDADGKAPAALSITFTQLGLFQ